MVNGHSAIGVGTGSDSGISYELHYIGFGVIEVESFRDITKINGIIVDVTGDGSNVVSSGAVYLVNQFGSEIDGACMIVF